MRVAVIGAGAAGLMAGISAARAGAQVSIVEKTADGGRKILISGGGRCNVLPSVEAPERFVSASSPQLVRRLLRAFPLREQRASFERDAGVPHALEEESGKLFPVSNRARDVRDALVRLASDTGATFRWSTTVASLEPVSRENRAGFNKPGWRVVTNSDTLEADAVIIATGGLSVPMTGSDGAGLAIARRLGHTIVPTYAALTPLLTDREPHRALSGLSLKAVLRAPSAGKQARSTGGFRLPQRG